MKSKEIITLSVAVISLILSAIILYQVAVLSSQFSAIAEDLQKDKEEIVIVDYLNSGIPEATDPGVYQGDILVSEQEAARIANILFERIKGKEYMGKTYTAVEYFPEAGQYYVTRFHYDVGIIGDGIVAVVNKKDGSIERIWLEE